MKFLIDKLYRKKICQKDDSIRAYCLITDKEKKQVILREIYLETWIRHTIVHIDILDILDILEIIENIVSITKDITQDNNSLY